MKYILIICLLFVGCATKAKVTFTDNGIEIKCSPLSSCEGNKGDQGIKIDTKFDLLKGIFTVFK